MTPRQTDSGPYRPPQGHAALVESGLHECASDCQSPKPVYPSFYRAVHDAWNRWTDGFGATRARCDADPDRYEPDLHRCFGLAGRLRVELHAAGIMLSSDGNGSDWRLEQAHRDAIAAGEQIVAWAFVEAQPQTVITQPSLFDRIVRFFGLKAF